MSGQGTGVRTLINNLPSGTGNPVAGFPGHTTDHNSIQQILIAHDNALTYSASLSNAIDNTTGTGSLVFSSSPTILSPNFINGASISGSAIATQAFILNKGYAAASDIQTLINKSLLSASLTSPSFSGTVTSTGSIVGGNLSGLTINSSSFTNSVIDGSKNTIINVPSAAFVTGFQVGSAQIQTPYIYVNNQITYLGGSVSIGTTGGGGGTQSLTFGNGLTASTGFTPVSSYNGTSSVALAIAASIVDVSSTQTLSSKTLVNPLVTGSLVFTPNTLGTPVGGTLEYDGKVFYLTPNINATEGRGVLGTNLFIDNNNYLLSNTTAYQSIFTVGQSGIYLASATFYYWEMLLNFGTTGTSTACVAFAPSGVYAVNYFAQSPGSNLWSNRTASTVIFNGLTTSQTALIRGTLQTTSSAYFTPLINFTSTLTGLSPAINYAYVRLTPLGASAVVLSGNWN